MQKPLRHWPALLALLVLLTGIVFPAVLDAESVQLDPVLLEELAGTPDGRADFLVFLRERADLSAADTMETRLERGQYVYQTLHDVAGRSQAGLRADLDTWGVPYHPFYIVNAVRVSGDLALAYKLAARPEVERVVADPAFNGIDDPPPGSPGPPAVDTVEWNIARVNADDVWALGYNGTGIVVGSVDTGADWTHPALVNQYRGGAGDHDYHWYDAFYEYAEPSDPGGHGTHTIGTMVGDDGAGNQVGMAPGAQWIACKVSSGSTWKASKYIECWEWMLAPTRVDGSDPNPAMAPHVINNSWSCPGSEGCDPDTLRPAAQALYAAGIAIAKSGGNTGSSCGSITVPGQYPELLATASFNSSDVIAGSSSRGPVTIDGEVRIKPDVAAPGVSVRSSVPGGGYASYSGTSMAAPHTAGLIALLWSAQPALIGDLGSTYQIVRATAEPRLDSQCPPYTPGGVPNNVWGWGIIDALAAVQAATEEGLGTLSGLVNESGSGTPLPGASVAIVQENNGLERELVAGPGGAFSTSLLSTTYALTATLYGYQPATAAGVAVYSNTTTPLTLSLQPSAQWVLSGTVTEQGSGLPLRATLSLLDTPVSADTDPATGFYSTPVAEGSYVLRAESPGYQPQERVITMGSDLSEHFQLDPASTYYLRDSSRPCGPAFDWIDITATGTPRNLNDDSSVYVSLGGGQFTFYGSPYSALYVGSNGYVTFGSGSSYPGGNNIPDPFAPNNTIYAFWDDLNPAGGSQGTIYTELVDGHLFVVEFYQVEHYPDGNPETFEIILDLDTGTIAMQYLQVSDSHWTSVGLENSDGSAGLRYAFHDPAVPADSLALVFHPTSGDHPAGQGMGALEGSVVVSGTGAPIAGAIVQALNPLGEAFSQTTDVSGTYSMELCADVYTATAAAAGYFSETVRVSVYSGSATLQDFYLEPLPTCDPVEGADFSWAPPLPLPGQAVTLTASATGTAPISYTWDLGDGSTAEGEGVQHSYAGPGSYTVWMTATNCGTATAAASHTLTVEGPPCVPVQILTVTYQISGCQVSLGAELTGTAPITWFWHLGPFTSTAASPVVDFGQSGTYTGTLEAGNCGGAGYASWPLAVEVSCAPEYKIYLPLVFKNAGG